jgi:hypothetical protein
MAADTSSASRLAWAGRPVGSVARRRLDVSAERIDEVRAKLFQKSSGQDATMRFRPPVRAKRDTTGSGA